MLSYNNKQFLSQLFEEKVTVYSPLHKKINLVNNAWDKFNKNKKLSKTEHDVVKQSMDDFDGRIKKVGLLGAGAGAVGGGAVIANKFDALGHDIAQPLAAGGLGSAAGLLFLSGALKLGNNKLRQKLKKSK
jgi:hypothetical protein